MQIEAKSTRPRPVAIFPSRRRARNPLALFSCGLARTPAASESDLERTWRVGPDRPRPRLFEAHLVHPIEIRARLEGPISLLSVTTPCPGARIWNAALGSVRENRVFDAIADS